MTGSSSPKSSSSRNSFKFLHNLTQLREAIKELPDPEEWPDESYVHTLLVNKRQKALEFIRKKINRGSTQAYRWVYEGKILIRKRDI